MIILCPRCICKVSIFPSKNGKIEASIFLMTCLTVEESVLVVMDKATRMTDLIACSKSVTATQAAGRLYDELLH